MCLAYRFIALISKTGKFFRLRCQLSLLLLQTRFKLSFTMLKLFNLLLQFAVVFGSQHLGLHSLLQLLIKLIGQFFRLQFSFTLKCLDKFFTEHTVICLWHNRSTVCLLITPLLIVHYQAGLGTGNFGNKIIQRYRFAGLLQFITDFLNFTILRHGSFFQQTGYNDYKYEYGLRAPF